MKFPAKPFWFASKDVRTLQSGHRLVQVSIFVCRRKSPPTGGYFRRQPKIETCISKTVNPLDQWQKFCQYWWRECNLTADFWFCFSWHPQISQFWSCDHYQPIILRICWFLAPSNQPITEVGPLSTKQIADLLGLCKANLSYCQNGLFVSLRD